MEWNVSKYRKLYPRVKVKKVNIGGVNITYASGKSAQFIWKNKIGAGAIVQIARSCDVIPVSSEIRYIDPAQFFLKSLSSSIKTLFVGSKGSID